MTSTAAILAIGNEILTGKIQDTNSAFLASHLFKAGISLRSIMTCPDEVEIIAQQLSILRKEVDTVFTSGGIGPTHDDVTVESVARSFDVPVISSPELESMLKGYHKEKLTEDHLRMALIPEGAEIVRHGNPGWPIIQIENVYLLPGVPKLFELIVPPLVASFGSEISFYSTALFVDVGEGQVATLLREVVAQHPEVEIGSYPQWQKEGVRLKLTVDGQQQSEIDRARVALVQALNAQGIQIKES